MSSFQSRALTLLGPFYCLESFYFERMDYLGRLEMRRSYAIFFLILFNLYTLGPILYQYYAPRSITKQWQSRIIKQDDPRLKELKVPMQLPPYTRNQEDFTFTDGKVELEGLTYRKVFKKLSQDTLYLKVIPDDLSITYQESLQVWINSVHDENKETSKSSNSKELNPTFLKEYVVKEFHDFRAIVTIVPSSDFGHLVQEENCFVKVPTPPPQV